MAGVAQNLANAFLIVSQPSKAIVSPWCKSLLQVIYPDMFYRYQRWELGRIIILYSPEKCLKLNNKMAAKFTIKMCYYSIYPQPLSLIT